MFCKVKNIVKSVGVPPMTKSQERLLGGIANSIIY